MNGSFSSLAQPSDEHGVVRSKGSGAGFPRRLAASLAVSCLLHAAVVLLPYLGEGRKEIGLSEGDGREPPGTFSAMIAATQSTPPPAAQASTGSKSDPGTAAAVRTAEADSPASGKHSTGAGLLPIPAPAFYPTNQLTKRPQPIAAADLEKPETSAIIASGKMILKLWIDQFGEVVHVQVENSELPEVFSRTAVEEFRKLRFVPGELKGLRVGSVMRIELTYDDGRRTQP